MKKFINIVHKFKKMKVLVIGDIFLDQYLYFDNIGALETGVPIAKLVKKVECLGGAGNVARNIRDLGGEAIIIGCVGNDAAGQKVCYLLKQKRIESRLLITNENSIVKSRIYVENKKIFRLDQEKQISINYSLEKLIIQNIDSCKGEVCGVVIADYAKGLMSTKIINYILNFCEKNNIPFFVDTKNANVLKYKGSRFIKLNRKEAEKFFNIKINTNKLINSICKNKKMNGSPFIITLDEDGLCCADKGKYTKLETTSKKIKSAIGAGDVVTVGAALTVLAGGDLSDAALIGNICAGLAVKSNHTTEINLKELVKSLRQYARKSSISR